MLLYLGSYFTKFYVITIIISNLKNEVNSQERIRNILELKILSITEIKINVAENTFGTATINKEKRKIQISFSSIFISFIIMQHSKNKLIQNTKLKII